MANQWALLVGINQYTALQPLMYAQADAIGLRNFFVDEMGIPIDHCLLLTDMSAAIEPYAHYPSRQETEAQLQTLCRESVQPGDLLWIFFSGYGLARNGQDYWMTIDADPMKLDETAIPVAQVFDILKTAKTDQIVLVLDVNRSQGAIGHQSIGQQTLALAQDLGVSTFLSCQPDQYAHETMAIRHGLFTKALLEGLRYHGCVTVSQLAAYMGDRVPELSQHHWRPVQNPAVVIPAEHKFMMVVPPDYLAKLPVTEAAAAFSGAGMPSIPTPAEHSGTVSGYSSPPYPDSTFPAPISDKTKSTSIGAVETPLTPNRSAMDSTESVSDKPEPTGAMVHRPRRETDRETEDSAWGGLGWWRILAAILAAIILAFVVGILVRQRPAWLPGRDPDSDQPTVVDGTADPENPDQAEAEVDSEVSDPEAAATATEATAADPESVADENSTAIATNDASTSSEGADEGSSVTGESALQRAEAAIVADRYGEARAWLAQVPPELRNETYDNLLQQANNQVAEAAIRNQGILRDARQIIQPVSASLLNDAIEQARQVPSDDPYYEQAQADIARWSRLIFDVAEGRAASGDVAGAIAAAELVPDDQPAIARIAQERIKVWQQQLANQKLIQDAQSSLQPGQASSFQNAIQTLQQITPEQPGYDVAQERIGQWSENIWVIARARAAQGDLTGAIAAAELVPEGTAAYTQAQAELSQWRNQR
ncbi:MAG: hypothetical protein AAGH78_10790 [Cyanobacteria bacterium P01_H01_bin.58]